MSRLLIGLATLAGTAAIAFGTIIAWNGDGAGLLLLGMVLLLVGITMPAR